MNQFNRKYKLIETYSLLLIDVLCILGAYVCALFLYRHKHVVNATDYTVGILLMLFCLLYTLVIDWNREFFSRGYYVEAVAILKYELSMIIATGFILFVIKEAGNTSRGVYGYFAIINFVLTYLVHIAFKKYMQTFYRAGRNSDKVLIVTTSELIDKVLADIKKDAAWSYKVTAIALLDKNMTGNCVEDIPVVADGKTLFENVQHSELDVVFIHLPDDSRDKVKKIISGFEKMGVTCHYSVDIMGIELPGKSAGRFAGYMVITYAAAVFDYRRMLVKRFMDIVGGIVGLTITAILTPFIALAIKCNSRGPVFFSQMRIGKNGRRFKMYKFRSMYIDAEERKKELEAQNEIKGLMFKMENDPRITKVGKFLRKTSLDELPQFYNILKGDMSLVGTRPPTCDEFEQYDIEYRRRLSITPGLTGMWQVSGRSDITDFDEVVKYDLEYIDNWSITLDIKILLQTIGVVLFGKGSK
ncbi:MAG: sugar transferase [Lachnospiraceae bacterium]|nr:sugar transferase [Lachnospiraceae bacterium]